MSPKMGYYIVVTDTEETEKCFFNGLRDSLPDNIRKNLVIKVFNGIDTKDMIAKCIEEVEYNPQARIPWIVFDRDREVNFDRIIAEAERNDINVGWSNPCFEIWMYAYLGKMPNISESKECWKSFARAYERVTGCKYSKSDKDVYRKIYENGDETKAIEIASRKHIRYLEAREGKPSKMCPVTTVYRLVSEIRNRGL